ncbi:PREDICTED: spermatogenesis-associated protein 2-like protein [Gekko japonicus]|uniref:Spermatogenesis-associated protein 2-like protein n=1 Tax=Gekko japonicus TaxID=146911 RepID=A0ABM1JL64_GEKJA|nr:PREDICTED: spermatogenesis-associated protein 2-like protein [Gekko japonicus]XP_015262202.1 PREDICTED: spermatogenesis-associated protein 2-like protein [Gekko japonicus]
MNPGTVLQEEYRRCLERDFRRGHTGVCADSSLKQMMWRQLLEDPELHGALQGEDTFAMIAGALRGQLDLGVALRNLCRAFEVLELAAVHLYFFPWRKEFSTIKTFSGVYVHVLQGVLSEADIARSFHRMGYVQRDNLHLVISQLPPGGGLLRVAGSFFAARVECEILAKVVEEVEPCGISSEELLQARKEARGGLEGCVAKLRSLACWPRDKDFCGEPADGVDLYRESPEALNPYCEPPGPRVPPQHPPAPYERSSSPRLRSKELLVRSPQGLPEGRSKLWGPGPEQPYGNGLMAPEGPDLETSFSFISLRRELSRSSDTDYPAQPGSRFLSPSPHYSSPSPQPHGASSPASPSARQPRSPQLSPVVLRRAQGLGSGVAGPELPRYNLHSCLLPGVLPSSCCGSCRLLHSSGCEMAQHCRSAHHVEELQSEKQEPLWLQRTEVDKLL